MSTMVSRCQVFAYPSDRALTLPSARSGFCVENSQSKSARVEQLVSGWSTPRNRERGHHFSLKPKKDAILKKKVSTRKCYNCGSSDTRQWVRGEEGKWLCHACGQYWRMNGTHRRPSLWHRPTFTRRRKDKSKNPSKTRRTRKESSSGMDGRKIRSNILAPLEIDPFARDVSVMPYSPVAVTSTLGHGWPSAHVPRKPVYPVVALPSFNVHFSKLCGV